MVDGSWKYNSLYIRFERKNLWVALLCGVFLRKSFCMKSHEVEFSEMKVELYPILNIHPWHHARKNLVTLPTPSSGNRYIFTVMDLYTKWLKAIAIQNKRSQKVAFELLKI